MADFEKDMNLEELAERTKAIYEPEQFPGAIMSLSEPFKARILVFASGKAIILDLKSSQEIDATIRQLEQLMDSMS